MPLCLGNSRYPAGETASTVDRGIRGSGSVDRSPGIPIIAVILDASMTPPLSSVPRPLRPLRSSVLLLLSLPLARREPHGARLFLSLDESDSSRSAEIDGLLL